MTQAFPKRNPRNGHNIVEYPDGRLRSACHRTSIESVPSGIVAPAWATHQCTRCGTYVKRPDDVVSEVTT